MKNNYVEKINYSIEKNEGVPFASLNSIESIGSTCLSKKANEWIYKIVNYYSSEVKYTDIIHLYESEVGAFATISDGNLNHYNFNIVANLPIANEDGFYNNINRLFLIDYTDFFKWVTPPVDSVDRLLKTLYKNDRIIICAPECHLLHNVFNIRNLLKNNNFFIESIFVYKGSAYSDKTNEIDLSTPLGLVFDSERLSLIVASKNHNIKEFICEFKENQSNFSNIFDNLKSGQKNSEISQGIYIDSGLYVGSHEWNKEVIFNEKYNNILNRLSKFSLTSIENIVRNFTLIEDESEIFKFNLFVSVANLNADIIRNRIYCTPLDSPAIIKESSLYGMELINNSVYPEYIYYFFNSSVGREILFLIRSDLNNFWKFKIPLPIMDIQQNIIDSHRVLNLAKIKLDSISFDVVDCLSTSDGKYPLIEKYYNIIEIFEELSDYEFIKKTIKNGESKTIEFKQTFSLDIKKNSKEKYIEDACIKTIAAFLNTLGGTLLVGVKDDGEISGIDNELKLFHLNSIDKMLLHFKNIFKNRIGEQFYPYIETRIILIDSCYILIVKCDRSKTEAYVDDKDFYVRTNPATDKLEGPKVIEYIKNHFGN
jgi:hypothetical protein